MFIGQGIVLPQSSIRVSNLSIAAPIVSVLGLTDNPTYGLTVQIGNETNYTLFVQNGTATAVSWGQLFDPDLGTTEEFGGAASPVDIDVSDGGDIVGAALVDGVWYPTPTYVIRQPPPTEGSFTIPDIAEGSPPADFDVSGAVTGDGVTLSVDPAIAGVSVSGTTLTIDGTQFAAQTGVVVSLVGTNSGGSTDPVTATFDVVASGITATLNPETENPTAYQFYETQSPSDLPDFATFAGTGNYSSSSGIVSPVNVLMSGGYADENVELAEGNSGLITFRVLQNTGLGRDFNVTFDTQYFFTATSLPGGGLALDINPIVPDTEVIDLDFGATTYPGVVVGDLRSGPYHAGGSGVGFTGLETALQEGDILTAEYGDSVVTTATATIENTQWLRDGTPIPGTIGDTYTLTSADLGTTISLQFDIGDGVNPPLTVIADGTVNVPAAANFEFDYVGRSQVKNDLNTVHTLTGAPLGAADASRVIWVVISRQRLPTSVTIGGVNATSVALSDNLEPSGANRNTCSAWKAIVPSGATGDIVVTSDLSSFYSTVEIYRTVNLVENGEISTDGFGDNSGATVLDLSVNTAVGNYIIAAAAALNGTQWAWSGLTEDSDQDGGTNEWFAAASAQNIGTAETPRAISASQVGASKGTAGLSIVLEAV